MNCLSRRPPKMSKLQPSAVAKIARRLEGIVNRTPVMTSRTLNQRVGCDVYLKCENFQRVGAFKFRGAYNAVSQLNDEQRNAGVITHSSGNHAQGLALAAQLLGVKAVIVMPDDAPSNKRAATAGYGAQIVSCKAIDREKVAADLVAEQGYTMIHPYDNDNIILGQGTAAYELFDEVGELGALFVPVGGGGLISGSALAAAAKSPGCQVIGVEPEIAADANRSWREQRIVTLDQVPGTIADGLRTRYIGQRNLDVMRDYVHDMVTVTEDEIVDTLDFIWTYLKIIVEPSSAVALAPLFAGRFPDIKGRVGIILSGGNVKIPIGEFFPRQRSLNMADPKREKKNTEIEALLKLPRILVIDEFDQSALDVMRQEADVDVLLGLDTEELLRVIQEYQALVVGPHRIIDGQVIEYGFKLQAIGCASAQLDNIDVSTARDMGIHVCYVPGGNAVAIAEHTFTRMLMLANQFGDGHLAGKTLGLIGFGRVGQQVVQRAQAFNMKVIVNQPRLTPELAFSSGVEAVDLVNLLAQADYVSVHVRFMAETQAIIGASELSQMKDTAFLINTGHTELIDEMALLHALDAGRVAGAALSIFPDEISETNPISSMLRRHDRTIISPHVTSIIDQQRPNLALSVAREIVKLLKSKQASEALSLELVPIKKVTPHEQIDDKRVKRLMGRLEEDGLLVNPPLTTYWKGKYVILDGATRFTSFSRLGYQHIIVQVVDAQQPGFELHTWYHAISHEQHLWGELLEKLEQIDGLRLISLSGRAIRPALQDRRTLCYFLKRDGQATLAQATEGADRLTVMNALVNSYTAWGNVERTLVTDLPRLIAQFPSFQAVAIFPQFNPNEVFDAATAGDFLPAGLTRFVIPGRILRLNAELERLKKDEPLSDKLAWFNQFLAEKLTRSRLRYYQEPVILLDE